MSTSTLTGAGAPLLVELFTEELPPKALSTLDLNFSNGLFERLKTAKFVPGTATYESFATPRRLAVLIQSVHAESPSSQKSTKLMPVKVAYGPDGQPTAALLKRLEKEGATPAQTKKAVEGNAEYVFLDQTIPGSSLAAGLQLALNETLSKLPIQKVMAYQLADGATTVSFVRPAHGLVALHGKDIVPVTVLGLQAGRVLHGHRFQGVADFELADADAYDAALGAHGKVIASFAERRDDITRQLKQKADELKSSLGPESDVTPLLDEVTALVEMPTVYIGQFEAEYLAVPQECLILTMRANQKYFPLFDQAGKLTNKFLIVSNMRLDDAKNIIEGNQRVVRPRLADARFFFETDKKTRLEARTPQLASVTYHNKLGSQLERVERVAKLASGIAQAMKADAKLAERAARLAKADLLTNMVGEFPELQGVMGRYYGLADGEDPKVAAAIEQHYRPRFAGDALPDNPIATALALADKLETLIGLFGIGQQPTGDKDPFALRRHALGVVRILCEKKLPLELQWLLKTAHAAFQPGQLADSHGNIPNYVAVQGFIEERARGYLRDQGYSHAEIEAVLSLSVQPSEYVERLGAVRRFLSLSEAAELAESDKRIRNILSKSGDALSVISLANEKLFKDDAEKKLFNSVRVLRPQVDKLMIEGNFEQALMLTAQVHGPVKSFFDQVMVNVEEADIRHNRFALLHEVGNLTNRVANISKLSS